VRISKIAIKNYRSCINVSFAPDPHLSVLIGPNGSGKTNVLSALRLIPALSNSRPRHNQLDVPTAAPCELRVSYDVDGTPANYHARINIVTSERNLDEIAGCEEYWTFPSILGPRKRLGIPSSFLSEVFLERHQAASLSPRPRRVYLEHILSSRGIKTKEIPETLEKIIGFSSQISYYSASQFTNPANCPISFEVESDAKRRIGISITGHKKFLFDLYQESRSKSEKFAEFMGLVDSNGIGLVESIDFNEITTSTSNYSVMTGGKVLKKEKTNLLVVPGFKVSGNLLSPSQLSEGTFKALALIFYLVTDQSSLLMIEEPEVCIHHGLLASVVELIKEYSRDKQVLVSTHSESVLDRVAVENVFQVKRQAVTGSSVSSISKRMKAKELSGLRSYLLNEGSLGEFWRHGDLEEI